MIYFVSYAFKGVGGGSFGDGEVTTEAGINDMDDIELIRKKIKAGLKGAERIVILNYIKLSE